MDSGLPKVDELDVLRQIKGDPRTCTILVVVLTVSKRDRDIAATQRLGGRGVDRKAGGFSEFKRSDSATEFAVGVSKRAPMVNV
jgi:CheY-like chemotaxis protein